MNSIARLKSFPDLNEHWNSASHFLCDCRSDLVDLRFEVTGVEGRENFLNISKAVFRKIAVTLKEVFLHSPRHVPAGTSIKKSRS